MVKYKFVSVKGHRRGKSSVSSYKRRHLVNRGKIGKIRKQRVAGIHFVKVKPGRFAGSRKARKGEKASVFVLRESRAGRIIGRA